MKRILIILGLTLLISSCEKYELRDKLTYDYNLDQPIILEFDVIPVGDVHIQFEDMNLEVNADYFNRYGIGIKLNLKPAVTDIEGPISGCSSVVSLNRKIYIVDFNFLNKMNSSGIAGFACDKQNKVVIGDQYQINRTLAHEIGHSLGLNHNEIENNVMRPYHRAGIFDIPNDFESFQIEEMLQNIIDEEILYKRLNN